MTVAKVHVCGNTGTVVLADLTEALHEGGWDFSIQDLQNRLDIFPCSISAQITGKQTEEVCEQRHTHTHKLSFRRNVQLYRRNAGAFHAAAERGEQELEHQYCLDG